MQKNLFKQSKTRWPVFGSEVNRLFNLAISTLCGEPIDPTLAKHTPHDLQPTHMTELSNKLDIPHDIQVISVPEQKFVSSDEAINTEEINDIPIGLSSSTIDLRKLFDGTIKGERFGSSRVRALTHPANGYNREKVFVAKKVEEGGKEFLSEVNSVETFRELLDHIQDVVIEHSYMGLDRRDTRVFRATLPDEYMAAVPQIKLKHLPQIYFDKNEVILKQTYNNKVGVDTRMLALCPALDPIYSDWSLVNVPKEEIMSSYHYLSFKVDEHNKIKSWVVGRDIDSNIVMDLLDTYVYLGTSITPQTSNKFPR